MIAAAIVLAIGIGACLRALHTILFDVLPLSDVCRPCFDPGRRYSFAMKLWAGRTHDAAARALRLAMEGQIEAFGVPRQRCTVTWAKFEYDLKLGVCWQYPPEESLEHTIGEQWDVRSFWRRLIDEWVEFYLLDFMDQKLVHVRLVS